MTTTPPVIVKLDRIGLSIPIYGHETRSLKKTLIGLGTGGQIAQDAVTGMVRVQALADISLEAHDGDRIAVLGNNGAGKSSLLRLIAGIYEPTVGALTVNGTSAPLLDVGLGIEEDATGRENILIRGTLLGLPRARIKAMEADIVAFTDLGPYVDMPVRTYSSGMRMRLAFAISVCIEPDVLLLDEWFSTGDASFLRKAEDRLNRLIRSLKVLFFASHAPDILRHTCNKALVLTHGRMVFYGPLEEGLALHERSGPAD